MMMQTKVMMKSPHGNKDEAKEDDDDVLLCSRVSLVLVSSSRNTQHAHLSRTPPPVPIPFLRKQRVDIVVVLNIFCFLSVVYVMKILIKNSVN